MDFNFLLNINVLTFLMVFIVFGFWQVLKLILKKDIDAKIIVTVNGAIAVNSCCVCCDCSRIYRRRVF